MTESLDWRTRARSASRSSALIALRLTSLGKASTGATSTRTHLPSGSSGSGKASRVTSMMPTTAGSLSDR